MLKQVSVMKRHPDLTMDAFKARYESHHAKFGEVLFKGCRRFMRRYVEPQRNPLTGQYEEMAFDVIMEIWWDSRADFETAMAALVKSDLLPQVQESGRTLFASAANPAFTVEEHDSPMGTDWPDAARG